MSPKPRILFLCTGNSCRSQMAEGWAHALAGDRLEAASAGTAPVGINPLAERVMVEVGVDLSGHSSKTVEEADGGRGFDHVITLCGDARDNCPLFTGNARVHHRGFPDPAYAEGDEEEVLAVFRQVRDDIRAMVETLPGSLEGSSGPAADG